MLAVIFASGVALTSASGGGFLDLSFGDDGGGHLIGALQDVAPHTLTLGMDTKVSFNMKFSDTFVSGIFQLAVSVPGHEPSTFTASACSQSDDFALPGGIGRFTYTPSFFTCPMKDSATMDFQVLFNESLPTELGQMSIKLDLLTESGAKAMSAHVNTLERNCDFFFGDMSGLVTIIDPDVPASLETNPFVHYSGGECQPPAPEGGCHRYIKVAYESCEPISNGSSLNWAQHFDDAHHFNSDGVLAACKDSVKGSPEIRCWGSPADDPQQCNCQATTPSPPPSIDARITKTGTCGSIDGCNSASSIEECRRLVDQLDSTRGHPVTEYPHKHGHPNGCWYKNKNNIIFEHRDGTGKAQCSDDMVCICNCSYPVDGEDEDGAVKYVV